MTLDTRDGIRAGGDRGPAIVPGKPDESILINAIRQVGQLRMPPDSRGGVLPENIIEDFEKWVKDGAPDPRDSSKIVDARAAKPEKIYDWDKERQYWAFQKPKAAAPPKVANGGWPRSDVDRFVLAKLEAKGLKPVGDADKRTLARRLYYDLIGLPPTSAQVEAFAKDSSPTAYEKLVDSLLSSPSLASNGGATGWMLRATASQREWTAISTILTHGAIVIMSLTPSTRISLTTASSPNNSPGTSCPTRTRKSATKTSLRPASCHRAEGPERDPCQVFQMAGRERPD